MFGVWYCYKRGREERLKAEKENENDRTHESTEGNESSVNDVFQSTPVVGDAMKEPADSTPV